VRVYIEGWDASANGARRLARSAGVELASRMDGDITHMVVGYGVRMKAAHHEFSVSSGVPLLSPDEFRALVTGDAGDVKPLGEIKTGPPPPAERAAPRMWRGSPPSPKNTSFDKGVWIVPMVTCGVATPFLFAHLATTKGTWLDGLWAVLYGFLLGFGWFSFGQEGEPTVPGSIALAIVMFAGGVHYALAEKRARSRRET